jgi:hypothetical protein
MYSAVALFIRVPPYSQRGEKTSDAAAPSSMFEGIASTAPKEEEETDEDSE